MTVSEKSTEIKSFMRIFGVYTQIVVMSCAMAHTRIKCPCVIHTYALGTLNLKESSQGK